MAQPIRTLRKKSAQNREINEALKLVMQMIEENRAKKTEENN